MSLSMSKIVSTSVDQEENEENSSGSVDHFQAGGRQLKGDSKPLPWFHPHKSWVFLGFFAEETPAHADSEQVSENQTQIGQM